MITRVVVRPNAYNDSVTLMALAQKAKSLAGVREAVALMGTDHNKQLLADVGLLDSKASDARSKDLILAIAGQTHAEVNHAFSLMLNELEHKKERTDSVYVSRSTTLNEAMELNPDSNVVLISVPGEFAPWEARKALEAGKHVMMFSDNVSLDDELALKKLAQEKGLFMMGPDCGTALINGAPLGFANSVRKGTVGIVAASGTGLQEVSTLIHHLGGGISQGIGVGGRDTSPEIGGRQMLQSLRVLADDVNTEVIVLISKPFGDPVYSRILDEVRLCPKPVVICFLGGNRETDSATGCFLVDNLESAALKAVRLAHGNSASIPSSQIDIQKVTAGMAPSQKYIRGLFTGGTLCYEALVQMQSLPYDVFSNIPLHPEQRLEDVNESFHNTIIDLGEDNFTKGQPHPMIEPSLRGKRILQESQDPEVAVLLLDFVLGYGAHPEPVDAISQELQFAMDSAKSRGGKLVVIASVIGTDEDPQIRRVQVDKLEKFGVVVLPSNRQASKLAADIVQLLRRRKAS